MAGDDNGMIERLFAVIEQRRGGDPNTSYTASLLAKGTDEVARKMGEEAVETMIAAAREDKPAAVRESADLIYHLLVLWARLRISPGEVGAELKRREGTSGHAEKKSRGDA
ncbi:MAG TPA: phosphoribosyl-ATP diphosphatase [Alphaproteobacteria bacterium]|nr:phosphoribosyl-ATP diphosphatase [Alphaproteobacteria bacterium]